MTDCCDAEYYGSKVKILLHAWRVIVFDVHFSGRIHCFEAVRWNARPFVEFFRKVAGHE